MVAHQRANNNKVKGQEMETTTSNAVAEWFADTWLMVAENDRDTYEQLMEKNSDSVSALSDELSEEWETLAAQVGELVDESISTTAGLFIREILQGWGSMPFDIIARRVLELKAGR